MMNFSHKEKYSNLVAFSLQNKLYVHTRSSNLCGIQCVLGKRKKKLIYENMIEFVFHWIGIIVR